MSLKFGFHSMVCRYNCPIVETRTPNQHPQADPLYYCCIYGSLALLSQLIERLLFFDVCSLKALDSTNIEIGNIADNFLPKSNEKTPNIECTSCSTPVGTVSNGVIRLFKWSICLRLEKQSAWESYPLQKFLSAQLLTLIASQATRKFLAYSSATQDAKEALLVSFLNLA